jgi:hypothetical protein
MNPLPTLARRHRHLRAHAVIVVSIVVGLLLATSCTSPTTTDAATGTPGPDDLMSQHSPTAPVAMAPRVVPALTPQQPAKVRERLAGLRLMNYYPASAPWTTMWTRWQPTAIDHDFATTSALGANAVRVILHPSAIGYPTPKPERISEVQSVLAMAAKHHLAVQLTLFDWFASYRDTTGSDQWANALLTPLHNNPNLVFVEVKNEIDPSNDAAMTWVKHELPVIRSLIGTVPVTVSVAGTQPLAQVRQLKSLLGGAQPDFYDIHYYGSPGNARAVFQAARSAVAPAPLYVGETGASSDGPDGDTRQDQYLRTVEWATHAVGLPPAAPWILNDIDAGSLPPSGQGGDHTDLNDGLYRTTGAAKPAAASIRLVFTGHAIPTTFNGDFTASATGRPACWDVSDLAGGQASWDPHAGHNAPGAAVLSHTSGSPSTPTAFTSTPIIQPVPGQRVHLTAWVRGEHATGNNTLAINWLDLDGHALTTATSPALPITTGTEWVRLSVDSAAPSRAASVILGLNSNSNSGSVLFDDVQFSVDPTQRPPGGP